MELVRFITNYEFELGIYNLSGSLHGFCERVAAVTGSRPTMLRQSLNPNYIERPSFITRTALFFVAWINLFPASGMRALYLFVGFVLQHAPAGDTRQQVKLLESHVEEVKNRVESVQHAIDQIPQIRLEMRKAVQKRRAVKKPKL